MSENTENFDGSTNGHIPLTSASPNAEESEIAQTTESSAMVETNSKENKKSLKERLLTDDVYRRKFVVWICLCMSFVVLGWNLGQGGPTLLDLQIISSCSLEQAALFFTAISAGYLVASFVISMTFDRFDKFLHIIVGNFGISVVMGVIPWCFYYGIMLTMHLLKGFLCGISELAATTVLIQLMGQDVKTYMQIMHFSYTVGGILSPLASAPFLTTLNETDKGNFNNTWFNQTSSTIYHPYDTFNNYSSWVTTELPKDKYDSKSEVYKAYSISSGLSVLVIIPFIVMFIKFDKELTASKSKKETNENNENLPLRIKVPALITISLISFVCISLEDTVASFTATYAVKHFKWTKQLASYATSVYWASFSIGSFSGIFIAPLFQISKLLLIYSFMVCLSFTCLMVTSLFNIDVGLWVSVGVSGFFMSLNFPLLFAWTEEDFLHATARITAMITISSSIGVIVSPIIVGVLLEYQTLSYCYFLLAGAVVLFTLFCIGKSLSVKTKQFRRATLTIEMKEEPAQM